MESRSDRMRPGWIAGARVMWITTDQAAEMYARFCRARYGLNAKKVVEAKAAELRNSGDAEGERDHRAGHGRAHRIGRLPRGEVPAVAEMIGEEAQLRRYRGCDQALRGI